MLPGRLDVGGIDLHRLEYLRRPDCGEKLKVHWYVALRCVALQLLAENSNTRRDETRRGVESEEGHPSESQKRPSVREITLTSAKAWQARVDKQCLPPLPQSRRVLHLDEEERDGQIHCILTSESPHF